MTGIMCKLEQYTSSALKSPVSLLLFLSASYVDLFKTSIAKLKQSQGTVKAQLNKKY